VPSGLGSSTSPPWLTCSTAPRGGRGRGCCGGWSPPTVRATRKSRLEREFRALLDTAPDIPHAAFNALVDGETRTHEVDAYWARERLVIQLDGFEFHRTRRDQERDAASNRDLELVGNRVMRLTRDDVTVHGERTLRRVRLAGGWEADA
jgi:hypothetical protein